MHFCTASHFPKSNVQQKVKKQSTAKNKGSAYILLCQMLQMHLMPKCILATQRTKKERCKNTFGASMFFAVQKTKAVRTFYYVKCYKCIWCSYVFCCAKNKGSTYILLCQMLQMHLMLPLHFVGAEHFPLENVQQSNASHFAKENVEQHNCCRACVV